MLRSQTLLAFSWCLAAALFAQNEIKFDRLSLEQGLSQSSITAILQDRHGFMWFGTQEGVNKYDGYSFTVFKYDPYDSRALTDNWVTAVCEDQAGRLWIGTYAGGLNRFNPAKKTFTPYRHNPQDSTSLSHDFITAICEDRYGSVPNHHFAAEMQRGTLWVGTRGGGLNEFDPSTGAFRHFRPSPADSNSLSDGVVTALYIDRSGVLWVGTANGGLNRFDRDRKVFIHYRHDPGRANSLSDNFVTAICETADGALWIGTAHGGLNKLDRRANTFTRYLHNPKDRNSLSSNAIHRLYESGGATSSLLWIGTEAGLNQFDPRTGAFTCYRNIATDLHSLSSDKVTAICEDRSGVLWIGTESGGLNKFDRKKKRFAHYADNAANPNRLQDSFVWSLCEDPGAAGRILWIGTNDGGLVKFDRHNKSFKHYRHVAGRDNSLSHNRVRAIHADPDDAGRFLWIGTHGGLDKFDTHEERFTHYRSDLQNPRSISANVVTVIYEDTFGALWIGTTNGLNKLDRAQGIFTRYLHDPKNPKSLGNNRVLSLGEDRWGTLWIGTRHGLYRFDRQTETFAAYRHDPAHPHSLSHDIIETIHCDHAGRLWLGTFGGGLNRIAPPAPSSAISYGEEEKIAFTCFTEKDGLANNVVYGILEDAKGRLWLSTNRGLSRFDPVTQTFKNYDPTDGLQSYEFNAGAYYKSPRGEMFFGGINGFNSFFPDSMKDNAHVPAVALTAFKKFDKAVEFDRDIADVEEIALSAGDDFFAFEFVALDYSNPQNHRYAYMLAGFDHDWIYCGARRYASYTNLDPGKYVFRVKGSNNDGVWNETGVAVKVVIRPPFWRTWWFSFLSIGCLIAGAAFSHHYRVRHKIKRLLEIERVRALENERVRQQVADDFHDELGQKLTNMTLFAEILKRNLNGISPECATYLDKIRETSKNLSAGVRNFIWALDPEQDSLYDLAIYLKDSGDEIFDKAGIDFRVHGISPALEDVKLPMNWRRHLTLIFKEGMNNVLKHATCKNVTLEMIMKHDNLVISLTDDGKGFNGNGSHETNGESGRGLCSMSNRAAKLQGELIVVTHLGKGTTIRFKGRMPRLSYGHFPARRLN